MVCFCCCCDPHKLAYISGIITAIEAVAFAVLNIVLICMSKCIIQPANPLTGQISDFWSWYFYDDTAETCSNVTIEAGPYPINATERLSQTTPEENFKYQITYLVLHVLWFVSCFIMIYGNARKRWGYYVPWLLITLSLLIMDVTISSFFIQDILLLDISYKLFPVVPMMLAVSLYFRGYAIWLINLVEFGTVMNAFCKSYHKRSKQERQQKKREKKERAEQFHQEASQAGKRAVTGAGAGGAAAVTDSAYGNYLRGQGVTQYHANAPPQVADGHVNPAFDPDHPPVYPNQPAPAPRELPKVPTELRPFSYLNPGFRPTHPHDVDGMKAGALAQVERGYLSDDGDPFRGPRRSPSYRPEPPPSDNLPKRHDSLRSLPVQQDPRPLRRYASSRDHGRGPGLGNSPAHDPRPPSEYAQPWDRQGHPNQVEQLREYLGVSKVFPEGDPRLLLGPPSAPPPTEPRHHDNPYHFNHIPSSITSPLPPSHHAPNPSTDTPIPPIYQVPESFRAKHNSSHHNKPTLHFTQQSPSHRHDSTNLSHHNKRNTDQTQRQTSGKNPAQVSLSGNISKTEAGAQLVHGGVEVPAFRRDMTARMSDRLRRTRKEKLADHARDWELQWNVMKKERFNRTDDQKLNVATNRHYVERNRDHIARESNNINNNKTHLESLGVRGHKPGHPHVAPNTLMNGDYSSPQCLPSKQTQARQGNTSAKKPHQQRSVQAKSSNQENIQHERGKQASYPVSHTPRIRTNTKAFPSAASGTGGRMKRREFTEPFVQVRPGGKGIARAPRTSSLSIASEDTLPADPAFPILFKVPGMRCRQEGAIMMHYHPCDGFQCSRGVRSQDSKA